MKNKRSKLEDKNEKVQDMLLKENLLITRGSLIWNRGQWFWKCSGQSHTVLFIFSAYLILKLGHTIENETFEVESQVVVCLDCRSNCNDLKKIKINGLDKINPNILVVLLHSDHRLLFEQIHFQSHQMNLICLGRN